MKPVLLRLSLLLLLMSCGSAFAQNLYVNLQGIKNDTGKIRVGLYSNKEKFRKEAYALKVIEVPAKAGTVQVEFTDLQPGWYAIMAYHDEDANGRLNLLLGMYPTEGYGLSNNPSVFGPPTFEDSAFKMEDQNLSINIETRY
ncbi:uncharacterized protein (DUF2141 family) [Azomonas agilis]|uniref:Uncharacterized protein (DUF2141 family) n=1 Tax=Azomonas agilis TaxID=116849 RepID=A0A562IZD2_9GAMM|nr:DUF2141 domain-containing protein [Azomonas agilis]TWH76200.1 uncharacterized protein (DUF2141 family) [Azomonas agilis]